MKRVEAKNILISNDGEEEISEYFYDLHVTHSAGLARCLNAVARVKWFPERKGIFITMNLFRVVTPPLWPNF